MLIHMPQFRAGRSRSGVTCITPGLRHTPNRPSALNLASGRLPVALVRRLGGDPEHLADPPPAPAGLPRGRDRVGQAPLALGLADGGPAEQVLRDVPFVAPDRLGLSSDNHPCDQEESSSGPSAAAIATVRDANVTDRRRVPASHADGRSSMLTLRSRAEATRCKVVSVAATPPNSRRPTAAWLVPILQANSR